MSPPTAVRSGRQLRTMTTFPEKLLFLLGYSVKPAVERRDWIKAWVSSENAKRGLFWGRWLGVAGPMLLLALVVFRSDLWFGLVIWIIVQVIGGLILWRAMPRVTDDLVQHVVSSGERSDDQPAG